MNDNEMNAIDMQSASEAASLAVEKKRQELLEEKRKRKFKLIKLGSLMALVCIILVFATISWFTMNREVEGGSMAMKADDMPFELSVDASIRNSSGTVVAYDAYLSDRFGYDTEALSTSGGVSSIKWVMTDETRKDRSNGLKPGSFGSFSFNIIPKQSGTYKIHFDLNVTGYYARFETNASGTIDPELISSGSLQSLEQRAIIDSGSSVKYHEAINYLKGHIIFFKDKKVLTEEELPSGTTDLNVYFSGRIDIDEGFDWSETITEEMVDAPQPVTIYWIWPNIFTQILFDDGSKELYDIAMFSSNQSSAPRTELMSYISDNGNLFFSGNTMSGKTSEEIAEMMTTEKLTNTDSLITLCNGYNLADQVIGENVKFILAELCSTEFKIE